MQRPVAPPGGVRRQALAGGLISHAKWETGLAHLRRIATSPDGTFCYTFFKGVARKPT